MCYTALKIVPEVPLVSCQLKPPHMISSKHGFGFLLYLGPGKFFLKIKLLDICTHPSTNDLQDL